MERYSHSVPAALSYESRPALQPKPNPLLTMALCFPGLLCWCWFLSMTFLVYPRSTATGVPLWQNPGPQTIVVCWAVAIATALTSFGLYRRKPRPWYVFLNLMINGCGLVFTGIVFLLILAVLAR